MQNLADKYYIRPEISGAFIESDFCDTRGPMISPGMWHDFCFPSLKNRINNIKTFASDIQILFHSCGNTRKLLNQFAEAGVQVCQSIQNIPEMWIGDLKRNLVTIWRFGVEFQWKN